MFTQGIWVDYMAGGERNIVVKDKDGLITEVICRDVRHWNKDIILAAPDMQKAIKCFIERTKKAKGIEFSPSMHGAWIELNEALAKAEGRQ